MIELQKVSKSFGSTPVLHQVSWTVQKGEFWGIIGPNGSGKSTLLHLISGSEKPGSGEIALAGKPASVYSRTELTRMLAVLQQDGLPPVSFPVREVIEMGRFPFLDWLGRDTSEHADALIDNIMKQLELTELAAKPLDELSGGQRQRAALGKVMAQEPAIVLLDEPTTFLDIRYQIQFMELVSAWQRDSGLTVVAVIHDLNLAALFCDKLLVLKEGHITATGTPKQILNPEVVREVFEVESALVEHPDSGVPQLLLRPDSRNVVTTSQHRIKCL
ncbi:ABC transporter ATP-binding protein [Paenibacillus caui]|uniref:ABC transporter ATP-binding protein n=1 Tax=Paenibacillus caui TaxID=2873927 RepID=UPI001CA90176|nr:ABC transporter ATP-binding protein [Paenibacillus caui]